MKRIIMSLVLSAILVCSVGCTTGNGDADITSGTENVLSESSEKITYQEDTKVTEGREYRRIACVGDSITYGAWSSDRTVRSYPALLQKRLGDTYSVGNFGYSGSSYVKTEINYKPYTEGQAYSESLEFEPDIVVIILGTNDTHSWEESSASFGDAVRTLIRSYSSLESEPLIYLCSPLCRYDNSGKNSIISEQIIPILSEIAEDEGCIFVNLYKKTLAKAFYYADGLHPNDNGYEYLANLIYDAVSDKLQNGTEQ